MFERGKESLMEVSETPAVSPTKKINYVGANGQYCKYRG